MFCNVCPFIPVCPKLDIALSCAASSACPGVMHILFHFSRASLIRFLMDVIGKIMLVSSRHLMTALRCKGIRDDGLLQSKSILGAAWVSFTHKHKYHFVVGLPVAH